MREVLSIAGGVFIVISGCAGIVFGATRKARSTSTFDETDVYAGVVILMFGAAILLVNF